VYIYFFSRKSTARTTHPILTHDGSIDAVWSKEVPFGVRMITIYLLGSAAPKTANCSAVHCAAVVTFLMINNFLLFLQDYTFHENNGLLDQPDPFGAGKEKLDSGDIPGAVLLFEAAVQKNHQHAEVSSIVFVLL